MSGCVFCDYSGPSEIIYEHEGVFIIEPINPVTPGHLLVIPRQHVPNAAYDPELTGWVFEVAARFSGREPFNLITSSGREATQTVNHLHVHYVPRQPDDGLMLPWSALAEASDTVDG